MRCVVDGNICSGKSTQVRLLTDTHSILTEKIEDWPLDLFYGDKSRWGLLLQLAVLRSFSESNHEVYERSPSSSRFVFWKMLLDEGTVTQEEDAIYEYYWKHHTWYPDVHIYIYTPPEICFERLQKRHQVGDASITLEYLKKIDTYYRSYISTTNAIVIDGTLDTETISAKINKILYKDGV
jgi:deoxyadenosine/deoxycytidine kinase